MPHTNSCHLYSGIGQIAIVPLPFKRALWGFSSRMETYLQIICRSECKCYWLKACYSWPGLLLLLPFYHVLRYSYWQRIWTSELPIETLSLKKISLFKKVGDLPNLILAKHPLRDKAFLPINSQTKHCPNLIFMLYLGLVYVLTQSSQTFHELHFKLSHIKEFYPKENFLRQALL